MEIASSNNSDRSPNCTALILGLRLMFKSIAKHFGSEKKRSKESSIVKLMSYMIWTRFKGTCMQEREENKSKPLKKQRPLEEIWNRSQIQMHSLYTRSEMTRLNSGPHLRIKETKTNGIKVIQKEGHLGALPLLQIKSLKRILMHSKRLIMRLIRFRPLTNWTLVFDKIFKLALNVEASRVSDKHQL